jgi:trehalose synthase-fused probable maltokinase
MSQRAAHALQESADTLDDRTRLAAHEYLGRMDQLDGILDGLLRDAGHLKKTRHHGDFHLGQVLVHDGDAAIVDFEGEPMRPLAERRAKHCALRDAAGMLRSLAYAAAVAGLAGQEWLESATDRFLDGYFERALSSPGCPQDRGAALRLVQFFTIEKALYEILYELSNRPTWVGIPLTAFNRLLGATVFQRVDRTA